MYWVFRFAHAPQVAARGIDALTAALATGASLGVTDQQPEQDAQVMTFLVFSAWNNCQRRLYFETATS